ncbi:hypothetical protein ACF0H5_002468 [Mactra antiquata]
MSLKVKTMNKSLTWTRHTSYPTIHTERIRIPAEISSIGTVVNKSAEIEINLHRARLDKLHRKNIKHIEARRDLVRKSMIAYTETLSSLNNSRNESFCSVRRMNDHKQYRSRKVLPLTSELINRAPPPSPELPDIEGASKPLESKPVWIKPLKGDSKKDNLDSVTNKGIEDNSGVDTERLGVDLYITELKAILSTCQCRHKDCRMVTHSRYRNYRIRKDIRRTRNSLTLPLI